MKKRLLSFKPRNESEAEFEAKLKRAWTVRDTTGTFITFHDKVSSSLQVFVALKEVPSSSASLPIFYLAVCRRGSGFRTDRHGLGRKPTVRDLAQAFHILLFHRAHFFYDRKCEMYFSTFGTSRGAV